MISSMWSRFLMMGVIAQGAALFGSTGAAEASRPENVFVYSALGPGSGEGALSAGGRAWIPATADLVIPVPSFELNYVKGLGRSPLDYELRLNSIGVLSVLETGLRFRLLSTPGFSLAAKADALGILLAIGGNKGGGAGAVFGGMPGLVASFGSSSVQFSVGMDVPLLFGAAAVTTHGSGAGTAFGYLLRPQVGVEFMVGAETSMYITAQVYANPDSKDFVPTLGLGATW